MSMNFRFRQPFLPQFATASFGIGAAETKHHEYLTREIGRQIAIWSHIENDMTVALALLLDVPPAH